jgi:hypothetical protein
VVKQGHQSNVTKKRPLRYESQQSAGIPSSIPIAWEKK